MTYLLQFAGCASDRQSSQRVNSFPMKDMHSRNSMSHSDSRRDAPVSNTKIHEFFTLSLLPLLPFFLPTLFRTFIITNSIFLLVGFDRCNHCRGAFVEEKIVRGTFPQFDWPLEIKMNPFHAERGYLINARKNDVLTFFGSIYRGNVNWEFMTLLKWNIKDEIR